jgi:predicted dinucleotide-binding enzyme
MKIAILGGTGSIGKGLALRWSGKHEIVVCSRELDKAMKAAGECSTLLSDKGLFCSGISGSTNETGINNLRPLDGGRLASSYMIESLTPFLINLAIRNGLSEVGVKFV